MVENFNVDSLYLYFIVSTSSPTKRIGKGENYLHCPRGVIPRQSMLLKLHVGQVDDIVWTQLAVVFGDDECGYGHWICKWISQTTD